MVSMKKHKDRNWLKGKYIDEKLSTVQIAKLCNCDSSTISYWLNKFNITIRSCGEGVYIRKTNHCDLSTEARQWLDGELLGDGCLVFSNRSAKFSYGSKYKEYINYISDTLNSFRIKQAGKIRKYYYKKLSYYYYNSLSYAELLIIRKRWYPDNKKKIIPRDLKLTPLLLRQEYIGDGSLVHRKKHRPSIVLSTCGFPIKNVEWLVDELGKKGFKATRRPSNNIINISTYSTKDFLQYIGNCPVKCYQYKFNY